MLGRFTKRLAKRIEYASLKVSDRIECLRSANVPIDCCKSVCLMLGPYRNLSTLTAATVFLHPHAQVLNHGGRRVFKLPQVNFLADFSPQRLDRFLRFAMRIAQQERRSDLGGSITSSHAFDRETMQNAFDGVPLDRRPEQVHAFFWKEPLDTASFIRRNQVDLEAILQQEERLRFLMPIRNPIDCALSNLRTGHVRRFEGLDESADEAETLEAVIREINWFAKWKKQYPSRFFYFFEHQISPTLLRQMREFLELPDDQRWLDRARHVMQPASHYPHGDDLVEHYRRLVDEQFEQLPEFAEGLQEFLDPA